ncbi:hypothetical protein [Planomonospora sp. ID82291]|uniref:hypothetical protein n=1 Tax=Planomonospora sp. ID82291 TaxID=2738136 RepID=UPI0018C4026C|nr:hypothetical protein [Planomonospora sp. ID82291]MBG0818903.1 hypothetical protein [Planomonospora sp. ID82291]
MTEVPTIEEIRIALLQQDRAARLGWTAAHADAVAAAAAGDLHADARGFYRTGRHGGRGRAVARARIRALAAAGFLTIDGPTVTPTDDGRDALAAWTAYPPAPADVEADELTPLYRGREATRRAREWHDSMAQREAEIQARFAETVARAEANAAAEAERRAARDETGHRYATVWDAIHADRSEDFPGDDGTVTTYVGVAPGFDVEETGPAVSVPTARPHAVPARRTARRALPRKHVARRRPRAAVPAHRPAVRPHAVRRGRPPRSASTR